MKRVAIIVALGWLTAACGDDEDATRIDVAINELAPGLPMRLDRVELRVTRIAGGETTEVRAESTGADYSSGMLRPWVVAVAPARASDVGSALYRFRAVGFVAGRAYVTKQARTTFVAGRRFVLPLRFEAACADVSCEGDLTCSAGACVSDLIECTQRGGEIVCTAPGPAAMDAGPSPPPLPPSPLTDMALPDVGQPDAAPAEAGPADASTDTRDARVPCPLEATRELDSRRCSASVARCIVLDCGSADDLDCIEACAARDGSSCVSCVQWNAVTCSREQGCEDEWIPLACCGDAHDCSEQSCARMDCPDEFAVFRRCTEDVARACEDDVRRCLR